VILLAFLYLRRSRRRRRGEADGDIDDNEDIDGGDQVISRGMIATRPSLITPFMSKFEHEDAANPKDTLVSSHVRQPEKLIPHRMGDVRIDNASNMIDMESTGNVTGNSSRNTIMLPQDGHDHDLRREVEQLRMVVETLREQQVPQSQIVYQDMRNVPEEPPPGYGPLG